MDNKTKEIFDITQEECAEVVVAISKISRFGIDNLKPGKSKTNRQHLEEELGDLQCMINILIEKGIVSKAAIDEAERAKHTKLEQWSTIFKE